ncbi:hypothetical protein LJR098_004206 [Rhizobium sp. LjRoot98]|uniref:hypothetical protein n=1 Tax=Rhizobium sp. LjRoot98 TaxID=3342345 RepID=UPI003ED0CAF8
MKQTHRQEQIIKNWALSKEFGAMPHEERKERFDTIAKFETLAVDIMCSGSSRILDVSAAAAKFPIGDMVGETLGAIELPYDTFFVDFGHQESLLIDRETNLFFEGAYVKQTRNDGISNFDIILSCNDPDYASSDDHPIGLTLTRMSRFYHIFIPGDRPLDRAVYGVSTDLDPFVLGDRFAVVAGTRLASKAILYLSDPCVDAEISYPADAPSDLVKRARMFDADAASELNWRGYPETVFVGRNVKFIPTLKAHSREHESRYSLASGF